MSKYVIDGEAGITVKTFVSRLKISRAELIKLKKAEDGITVNGKHVTVRYVLEKGDVLNLSREDGEEDINDEIIPVDIPIEIAFENEDIIAVNKPPFMPTHPSHNHHDDTLANALCHIFKERGVPFVFRSVNRLDRDTSGIVIVAKNKSAAFRYSKIFSSGNIVKKYLCVVDGIIDEPITVEKNIKREYDSIIKRVVCEDNEGQYAKTEIKPLCAFDGMTLCEVTPITGRTHQIRVHLSYLSHPITGDTLYGKESALISRQALHCYEVYIPEFDLRLNANLTKDIKDIVSGYYNG